MFESEFAKIPMEAPRRLDSLPGLRVSGAIPRTMLLLPLLFCGFFLMMPLAIMSTDPAMRLAMGPGEFAPGRVISVGTLATCRGAASHRVKYTFTADGREYRGATSVCEESAYYAVNEGDAVEVRYLKRDPAVNALRTGRNNEAPPIAVFLMMPVLFLLVYSAVYWPAVRDVLRAKRLFKAGRMTNGHVVFVKKRSAPYWAGMPGMGAAEVFVSIPTSANGTREVVAPCRNEWLINQLSVGSTVHVAYADDKAPAAVLLDAYLR